MVKSIYAESGRNLVDELLAPVLPKTLHREKETIEEQNSGYGVSSLSPVEEEAEPISESSEGEVKRIVLETTVEYPCAKSFKPGELISGVAYACHI